MLSPIQVDPIKLARGNTTPVAWRLVGIDSTGSEWVLAVRGPGIYFEKSTEDEDSGLVMAVDQNEAEVDRTTVTWTPTPIETRRMLTGQSIYYEIERRAPAGGEQRTYLKGTFVATDGLAGD